MSVGGSSAAPGTGALLPLVIPAGSLIVRIHRTVDDPVWFGPARGTAPMYRFDAPHGEYRTLYAAAELSGAFVETVLRQARRIVARSYVEQRAWAELRLLRDLKLAKVHGEGLVWHGVTGDISTGDDYPASQAFAAQLHADHPDLDGIAYRARHDNDQICYALFDRVDSSQLVIEETHSFTTERAIVDDLLRRYNASWDPMTLLPPPPP